MRETMMAATDPDLSAYLPPRNRWHGPSLHPIGMVHAPPGESGTWQDEESRIMLHRGLEPGLAGLEGYSHVIVVYWLDQVEGCELVRPGGAPGSAPVGVFASRTPFRPNALGVCVAELVEVHGRTVRVRGLDALDGSPVLDIKPYLPRKDAVPGALAHDEAELGADLQVRQAARP